MRIRSFAIVLALAASSRDSRPAAMQKARVAAPRLRARLVDQRDYSESLDNPHFRVEVRGAGTDTIPGVWTTDEPTVVDDSLVVGTLSDSASDRLAFFRYHRARRRIDTIPMGKAFREPNSGVGVSMDGRRAALARFESGDAAAEILSFSDGALLFRSPATKVSPSDGRLAHVFWDREGDAIIAIWADMTPGRPWVRFHFDGARRRWSVDSIPNGE